MYNKDIDYKKKFIKYKKKYEKLVKNSNMTGGSKNNKRNDLINLLKKSDYKDINAFKFKAIGLLYIFAFDNEKKKNMIDKKFKKEGGFVNSMYSLKDKEFNKKYINYVNKYL
jgi:hypothetical protein